MVPWALIEKGGWAMLEKTYARFATTSWTQIRALAADDDRRAEAIETLASSYWPPVYAYLRSRGHRRDQAADLTQQFFSDVLLTRQLFERAEASRGRLRNLILTALQRFSVDVHRQRSVRGDQRIVSWDQIENEESRYMTDGADSVRAFERRWAVGVFEQAIRRCEQHFQRSGRVEHWKLFAARVLEPALNETKPQSLAELAPKFGFRSPAIAAAAVQVVKRRLMTLLREVVAETVNEDADLDEELQFVEKYLAG